MSEIVDVWETYMREANTDGACIHSSIHTVFDEFQAFAEELTDGQSLTFTVSKKQMTAEAYEALPDFEGY